MARWKWKMFQKSGTRGWSNIWAALQRPMPKDAYRMWWDIVCSSSAATPSLLWSLLSYKKQFVFLWCSPANLKMQCCEMLCLVNSRIREPIVHKILVSFHAHQIWQSMSRQDMSLWPWGCLCLHTLVTAVFEDGRIAVHLPLLLSSKAKLVIWLDCEWLWSLLPRQECSCNILPPEC